MKFVDPLSPLAGNAWSHAVPNAVWHASRHACFLSLGSLAHRVWHSVTPVNSAHTSTHVFFESDLAVSVTRPEPGGGEAEETRVFIAGRRAELAPSVGHTVVLLREQNEGKT